MKLILGNKNYSSWSLRGWLAAKQSGLPFEEIMVPLYGEDWDQRKRDNDEIAPSSGKVPVLGDGDAVVWDSVAIIEYLADKVGRDRFWPKADDARAMARDGCIELDDGRGGRAGSDSTLRGQLPVLARGAVPHRQLVLRE